MARTVYIVGAGFSMYAGLPLQDEFTDALILAPKEHAQPSKALIDHVAEFIHHGFDHNKRAKAKFWPNLEDIFTNIDLAANTGHHLGSRYPPSRLRMTRRALLARTMLMLDERYSEAEKKRTKEWKSLDNFFGQIDVGESAFISLNWDTVIERRLAERRKIAKFNYRCGAKAAEFGSASKSISMRHFAENANEMSVVKIHGSVNWLYCDNCRQLYWFPPENGAAIAMQLITCEEGKKLGLKDTSGCATWGCQNCSDVPLTTRIATFSFIKALDFPMFDKSWLSAEQLLRRAQKWVFIGYSLPAADFEFKHLLKRVQLVRAAAPKFVVITGGSDESTEYTYANYQRFFGRRIKRGINVFMEGLSDDAIKAAK